MLEKDMTLEIKHPELILSLVVFFIFFILNLQVTFNSPIVFGDEGFHSRLAQWIASKVEIPTHIPFQGSEIQRMGYYRPPLWNILQASFLFFFGSNEFWIRFLTPFIAFLTSITTFLLVKRIFDFKVALAASVIIATLPSFVTYSVLFYTDILFTLCFSLFFLFFMLAGKEGKKKYLLLSAIFGAYAFLTKMPGLSVYLCAAIILLLGLWKERSLLVFKRYAAFISILIAVPTTFLLRNWVLFSHPLCYHLPFIEFGNMEGCRIDKFEERYEFVGRVEQVGTEQSVYRMGISNYLDFAYGPLYFVVLSFFAGLILLTFKRDPLNEILLVSVFAFFLIFSISTTRAEDTARYTLGWVPIIAIVSAKWFDEVYTFLKQHLHSIALVIFVIILILSWQNFNGKLAIMARVKQFSPTFFEACDWIRENTPGDSLLMTIWAHRATYNCQRDTIGNMADIALSKDLNYTLQVAKKHGIDYLFIQKFSIDLMNQHLAERYDAEFVQFLENNPNYFKKVYENGPSLQQCLQQGYCDGNIVYRIVEK